MLIEFGGRNFCSFKESFSVSFRLKSSVTDYTCDNSNISKMVCLAGANASGKTNILKSLQFIYRFIDSSFQSPPDSKIKIKPFFKSEEPVELYIEFESKKVCYRYEVKLTEDKVISEILYRKKEKLTKIVERKENSISFSTNEFSEIKKIKLRNNCSFISSAKQFELQNLAPIWSFFNKFLSNISESYGYIDSESLPHLSTVSKVYSEDQDAFIFVKKVLMESDTGISDIKIVKYTREDGEDVYHPIFMFKYGNESSRLSYFDQSSGTKSLYMQLWYYSYAFLTGGVIALDEIDIKLHPAILPNLLEKHFLSRNDNNAQIIFTTHNSDIMDFLGKYRVYLVTKENNESYCYRLDEIPGDILRNDRSITAVYKDGKIGGVPFL